MINPLSNPSYLLPPLIAVCVIIGLLVLVWQKSQRDFSSQVFCGLLLSLGLWSLFTFGMRSSPDVEHALPWEKALIVVGVPVFVLYYHFTVAYTKIRRKKWIIPAIYSFLVVFVVLVIAPDLAIKGMSLEHYGYAPIIGPIGFLIFAPIPLLVAGGAYNLLKSYGASSSSEERNRLLYLTIAALFPLLGAGLDAFSDLPPASIWSNLIFGIICSIAILKYHLLDIRIVLRRGLAYLLTSVLVAVPFIVLLVLPSLVLAPGLEPWWYGLIILLLAIILRPLYGWAQVLVDKLFYRERYDYLKALQQFSRQAQSIVNVEDLGSSMVRLVSGALRTKAASLLLPSQGNGGLAVISSTLESPPRGIVLRQQSRIVNWLEHHQDTLFSENFDIVPQLQSLSLTEKNRLEQMGARLYVPIKTRKGELAGVLILGSKLSQQSFSDEDKHLLTALSSQMAMALENARLYSDALQARENLERWLDCMTDCVMIVNATYTVEFMNRTAIDKLGYRVGENCCDTTIKETACPGCPIQNYVRGNKEGLHYSQNIGDREYDIVATLLSNPDGSLSIIEVLRDITERKRAEEELKESEARYRALIRLGGRVGEAVIMLDDTEEVVGLHIFASDEWSRITGYSKKELLAMSFFGLVHPKDRAACLERHHRRRQGENVPGLYEISIVRKDGTEVPIEITAAVTTYKGKPANVGYIRDITERKQAEEREKELQQELLLSSRLASIGELAAGVAHEVNNPLTGILGFSQRLLRKSTDEAAIRDLERIHNEAQRAAKVVQNLLTFARRREIKKEYLDANEILASALELRAYELRTSNIELAVELTPDLPKVMADFHQMQDVFLNIILNAEQAMVEANQGRKLNIKTQKAKGYIRLCFTDDGPGILAEHLDKLFDPFFTTRGGRDGTGLGLSVCHGIVTEHGGKIYAKSKPGKGATLTVELPLATEYPPNDDLH